MLIEFRPWLDAARILLLVMAHLGTLYEQSGADRHAHALPSFECGIRHLGLAVYLLRAEYAIS
jgi:hypothetical protein